MTQQAYNIFRWGTKIHDVVGRSTEDYVFSCKRDLDYQPKWLGTGCYRGYIAVYAIKDEKLILESLCMDNDDYVELVGVKPINECPPDLLSNGELQFFSEWLTDYYIDLNYNLEYTGSLYVAETFERWSFLYQYRALKREEIYDLEFFKDQIISDIKTVEEVPDEEKIRVEKIREIKDIKEIKEILYDIAKRIDIGIIKYDFYEGSLTNHKNLSLFEFIQNVVYSIRLDFSGN